MGKTTKTYQILQWFQKRFFIDFFIVLFLILLGTGEGSQGLKPTELISTSPGGR